MSISSAVVTCADGKLGSVKQELEKIDNIDVHQDNGAHKIVIVIDDDSISKEVKSVKKVEAIDGVVDASIVYFYAEDELSDQRDEAENGKDVSDILKDNIDAGSIVYEGSVYNHMNRDLNLENK